MPTLIRLNKHIASLGIASRRKADELISSGRALVNGQLVTMPGTEINPETDVLTIDGVVCDNTASNHTPLYIILNKPVGYISSTTNEQGTSVLDLLTPEQYYKQAFSDDAIALEGARLYPVGRLDKDSEGLVLLTNDGDLTNELTHPRYEHEKEYEVTLDKGLTPDARKILAKGMLIDGDHYGGMEIVKEFNKGRRVILTLILREGKNRHIRKMLGRLGYNISVLRRVRINKLKLGTLSIGKWKFVKKEDIV